MSALVAEEQPPSQALAGEDREAETSLQPILEVRPEAVCYRGQTLTLLRHFYELSCQVGRLPSLLGREFFCARVSHHAIPSFEEQVVFACDIELCLGRLSDEHAEILTLVGLYDFTRQEISAMLHCGREVVTVRVNDALDALTELFLQAGVLAASRPDRRQRHAGSESGRTSPKPRLPSGEAARRSMRHQRVAAAPAIADDGQKRLA